MNLKFVGGVLFRGKMEKKKKTTKFWVAEGWRKWNFGDCKQSRDERHKKKLPNWNLMFFWNISRLQWDTIMRKSESHHLIVIIIIVIRKLILNTIHRMLIGGGWIMRLPCWYQMIWNLKFMHGNRKSHNIHLADDVATIIWWEERDKYEISCSYYMKTIIVVCRSFCVKCEWARSCHCLVPLPWSFNHFQAFQNFDESFTLLFSCWILIIGYFMGGLRQFQHLTFNGGENAANFYLNSQKMSSWLVNDLEEWQNYIKYS